MIVRRAAQRGQQLGAGGRAPAMVLCAVIAFPVLGACAPQAGTRLHRPRVPRPAAAAPSHMAAARAAAPAFPYLLLKLAERRLYLVEDADEPRARSFPVAVGREGYETPTGRFRVVHKSEYPEFVQPDWDDPVTVVGRIASGDPANPLGARWIGFTSAYGWDIGFHGTPRPELLGQAVSHGCVRMRNRDVIEVYDRVVVGTTVVVQP